MYREERDDKNKLIGIHRTSDDASIPIDIENKDYEKYLVWKGRGNVVIQDSTVLTRARDAKKQEAKNEALRRIILQVPEWDSFDKIFFLSSFWNLLDKSSATIEQKNAVAIYSYGKKTVLPDIENKSDVLAIFALDVKTDYAWPF